MSVEVLSTLLERCDVSPTGRLALVAVRCQLPQTDAEAIHFPYSTPPANSQETETISNPVASPVRIAVRSAKCCVPGYGALQLFG
jgi:hypothetical protein